MYFIIYINIDFLKPSFRSSRSKSSITTFGGKKIAMEENWAATKLD